VGGIAALSGKVLSVLQTELKPDDARHSLAVFIGHGSLDPQLPSSGASEARVVLETLGINPDYHLYEGMRHTINSAEMTDLNAWLQKALSRP
jgi:phospholipase/carboxylesterase